LGTAKTANDNQSLGSTLALDSRGIESGVPYFCIQGLWNSVLPPVEDSSGRERIFQLINQAGAEALNFGNVQSHMVIL